MPKRIEDIITSYNNTFESYSLETRIEAWTPMSIVLHNNITLRDAEKRKFRVRANSKHLLPHLDEIYSTDESEQRDKIVRRIQSTLASATNKNHWNNLGTKEREEKIQHMRTIQKLSPPYHLRKPREHWNKGKTKHTDSRLMAMSISRSGDGNPMYGTKMSDEEKQRKSTLIKNRILSGKWTPHVHNSRTHWQCSYGGQKYRSSWETMYAFLHPDDEYEKIRIQYHFEGNKKIYIVDFVNCHEKILTEIKPVAHLYDAKFLEKQKAAIKWCNNNGYNYRVLTEQYFVDNYERINFEILNIPNLREKLTSFKRTTYETNKKNRNQKTRTNVQSARQE